MTDLDTSSLDYHGSRPRREFPAPMAAACLGGLYVTVAWAALIFAATTRPAVRGWAPCVLIGGWLAAGRFVNTLTTSRWAPPAEALSAVVFVAMSGTILGVPADVVVSHPCIVAGTAATTMAVTGHRPLSVARRRPLVSSLAVIVVLLSASPATGWISSARSSAPTATALSTGGIDASIDTHQWLASQAILVLRGDGASSVASFFDQTDPTAPGTTPLDPASVPSSGPLTLTYRWRLLRGARDADGVLYPAMRDHFHNYWTHRGRQWVLGGSAASNAEAAFDKATTLWATGDRGESMYWLGAAVHLLDDACVPQHQFFALNPYHHQYELWVLRHQNELAVDHGGIYAPQFRVDDGHGGDAWTSAHPRGWVDECAHRAARNLQAATHPNGPTDSSPSDPRWRTAPHIANTQRLTAGFIQLFFDRVGAP